MDRSPTRQFLCVHVSASTHFQGQDRFLHPFASFYFTIDVNLLPSKSRGPFASRFWL